MLSNAPKVYFLISYLVLLFEVCHSILNIEDNLSSIEY